MHSVYYLALVYPAPYMAIKVDELALGAPHTCDSFTVLGFMCDMSNELFIFD